MKKIKLILVLIAVLFLTTCTGGFKRNLAIYGNPESGPAPLSVTLMCSSDDVFLQDDAVENFYIDAGDGTEPYEGSSVVHVYETPGIYIAQCFLYVESAISGKDLESHTASTEINVTEPTDDEPPDEGTSPVVSIEVDPDVGLAPLQVYFTGNVTGGDAPMTYLWDFDDTNTSTEQNPVHTFNDAGTYSVTFTVTDTDGDSDEATVEINVSEESDLEASIDVVGGLNGYLGIPMVFNSVVTGGTLPYTNYTWTFGDESVSSVENPSHTFFETGDFDINLWVSDSVPTTVGADPVTVHIEMTK